MLCTCMLLCSVLSIKLFIIAALVFIVLLCNLFSPAFNSLEQYWAIGFQFPTLITTPVAALTCAGNCNGESAVGDLLSVLPLFHKIRDGAFNIVDQYIYMAGDNFNSNMKQKSPNVLTMVDTIKKASTNPEMTRVLLANGGLYCLGYNNDGLANDRFYGKELVLCNQTMVPKDTIKDFEVGLDFTIILTNHTQELLFYGRQYRSTPLRILPADKIVMFSLYKDMLSVLTSTNNVITLRAPFDTPASIICNSTFTEDVMFIAQGQDATYVLDAANRLYSRGNNLYGELGIGCMYKITCIYLHICFSLF